jgi:hypothetical protein
MTQAKDWALALMRLIQSIRDGLNQERRGEDHYRPRNKAAASQRVGPAVESSVAASRVKPLMEARLTLGLINDCGQLPRISASPQVVKLWWEVGQKLLLAQTDNCPEKHPELRALGIARAGHYSGLKSPATMKLNVDLERAGEFSGGSVDSNVRGKIFTEIAEEFGRIARHISRRNALKRRG